MALGPRTLGLNITTIIPELTLAAVIPQLAPYIPLQEASLADAHESARELARAFETH
jgi:FMN-dependent NADH-azoreductase